MPVVEGTKKLLQHHAEKVKRKHKEKQAVAQSNIFSPLKVEEGIPQQPYLLQLPSLFFLLDFRSNQPNKEVFEDGSVSVDLQCRRDLESCR